VGTVPDGDRQPGNGRSKRLTAEETEALIRFAISQIAYYAPYQAATAVKEESRKHGPTAEPISRRAANTILDKARARLRADAKSIEPDLANHVLYKVRDVFEEMRRQGKTRECVELLKIEATLAQSAAQRSVSDVALERVEYHVVNVADAGVDAGSGDGSPGPEAAGE
jgi:hypothetical protein